MVSLVAMIEPTNWPISGLKYGPVQVSGASTTPSADTISPATIFRIASPRRIPAARPSPAALTGASNGRRQDGQAAATFLATFVRQALAGIVPAARIRHGFATKPGMRFAQADVSGSRRGRADAASR